LESNPRDTALTQDRGVTAQTELSRRTQFFTGFRLHWEDIPPAPHSLQG